MDQDAKPLTDPDAAIAPAGAGISSSPRPLSVLRGLIDEIDARVVEALNDRAKIVMEVGLRKAAEGTPVYAPHREAAVLSKVLALNRGGPLLNVTLEAIYREIMSGSFALERSLRIGYLGPPGSFSHEAALKQFGSSVAYENLRSIEGVFEEVSRGHVDYGIVPVENGSIGSVAESLDGFFKYAESVAICAEVQVQISQAFITAPGALPSDIKFIASKPEALGQCRRWIATQYPHAQIEHASSTSAAAQAIADRFSTQPDKAKAYAAIGPRLAAAMYDLPVMFPDIQDISPNVTRFLILCNAKTPAAASVASGVDKTSVLFVCHDRPGALRDVLDAFASADVNLSHIEKRPCPPPVLSALTTAAASGRGVLPLVRVPVTTPSQAVSATRVSGLPGSVAASADAGVAATGTSSSSGSADTNVSIAKSDVPPSLLVPAASGGRGSVSSPFVYAFFVEAAGHISTEPVRGALEAAASHCVCMLVLGSFPSARRVL